MIWWFIWTIYIDLVILWHGDLEHQGQGRSAGPNLYLLHCLKPIKICIEHLLSSWIAMHCSIGNYKRTWHQEETHCANSQMLWSMKTLVTSDQQSASMFVCFQQDSVMRKCPYFTAILFKSWSISHVLCQQEPRDLSFCQLRSGIQGSILDIQVKASVLLFPFAEQSNCQILQYKLQIKT